MTIKAEFEKRVMGLFAATCTSREHDITAEELIRHLKNETHKPNAVLLSGKEVRLVYDNITVTVPFSFELIKVEYLENMVVKIADTMRCDVQQLGQFIQQLDEAVPTWYELWDRHKRVLHQSLSINDRRKAMLAEMRNACCKNLYTNDLPVKRFRLAYYNIRAEQFMLEHEIPDWVRQMTEQRIWDRCMEEQLVPPMEEWCNDYEIILAEVKKRRQELIDYKKRKQEEEERKKELNRQKLEDMQKLLGSLKLNDGFALKVENRIWNSHHMIRSDEIQLTIHISTKEHRLYIRYEDVESKIPYLVQNIERFNELIPQLDGDTAALEKVEKILNGLAETIQPEWMTHSVWDKLLKRFSSK